MPNLHSSPKKQEAFTLIEMLVVMVLVGLMATLIVQGFGYSMGLYQRVIKTQRSAYNEVLAYNWLRSSLSSPVAARPKDRGLEGSVNDLSTYTYQPLLVPQGMKTLVGWRLVNEESDVILRYSEGLNTFDAYRWVESRARFEYLNDKGQWIGHWPPDKSELPPLPVATRVVVTSGTETRNYVVSTKTRLRPLVTMDEILYGR